MKTKATQFVLLTSILALSFLIARPLHAQVAGATLSGTITDPQGGAVPNAKIIAKNTGTGLATETNSNTAGAYTIPNLIPGDYQVAVSASGFTTALAKVTLTVGAKQEMNIP